MGLTIQFSKSRPSGVKSLRVISCNLQNGKFELNALNNLIVSSRPDVVALQEYPVHLQIKALEGWHHLYEADLHIFSRFPVIKGESRKAFVPLHSWPRSCFLYGTVLTPAGNLTVATVHLPSPRYGLQNILDRSTLISLKRKILLIDETIYRRKVSKEIAGVVTSLPSPKIIAGDFNMPVESSIYKEYWSAYRNAFSDVGTGYGWSERVSVFRIPVAVRIDHILLDKGIVPTLCETGPDIGSDHLPVIADIAFQ